MESTVKAMEQKLLQAIASERSATETLTEFRARYNTMEEKIRIEAEASSRKEVTQAVLRLSSLLTEVGFPGSVLFSRFVLHSEGHM